MSFWNIIQLIRKFTVKMDSDRIRAHSAEAAFFIIMSVFPMLMLLLTLVQFTPLTQEQVLYALNEITPFEIRGLIEPTVSSLFNRSSAIVSWTAIAALWTAGKGIMGIADGLNSINRITERRNYIVTRLRAASYTIVLILALTVSLGILVFGYSIVDFLRGRVRLLEKYPSTIMLLPLSIAMVILIFLFMVLYTFLPNRYLKFRRQFPGAVFTAVSWALFSYAFTIYLDFAVNMSVIYGSLTTLIVVMLWLYACMYLLFMGAEINQYIAHPELFTLQKQVQHEKGST